MRIGLFFGTFTGGGAERMMINLARGLHDTGNEVIIYVVNKTGVLLKEIPHYIQIRDYEGVRGAISIVHKIRKTLLNDNLDALVSTQEHINASVALASLGVESKTKIIFREANNPQLKKVSTWRKYINKKLYRYADHHVAVSQGVKESMAEFYQLKSEEISVIYNPVVNRSLRDLADRPVEDHQWFQSKRNLPVIIGMGRFHPQKGFDDLIEAFALLRKKMDAKLVIFGDKNKNKEYYEYLKEKTQHLKLVDDIDFPGFVVNPYQYLARASLFVLSSKYEGLPGVLIQAMACGCPVVSTDCPSGPREILNNNEYGKLVPVSSPDKLAEAMVYSLMENHNSGNLIRRASEYSVDKAVQSYLDLIRELKSNQKPKERKTVCLNTARATI